MKRLPVTKQLLPTLAILLACGLPLITPSAKALAAGCSPSGTLGQLSTTVSIPTTGEYVVWSRIKVPSANNSSYLLGIDGTTCYTVSGASVPANSWAWVNYHDNATT